MKASRESAAILNNAERVEYEFGPFTLVVQRHNKVLPATLLKFGLEEYRLRRSKRISYLLVYLLEKREQPVSASDLIKELWPGEQGNRLEDPKRCLTSVIQGLRDILDKDPNLYISRGDSEVQFTYRPVFVDHYPVIAAQAKELRTSTRPQENRREARTHEDTAVLRQSIQAFETDEVPDNLDEDIEHTLQLLMLSTERELLTDKNLGLAFAFAGLSYVISNPHEAEELLKLLGGAKVRHIKDLVLFTKDDIVDEIRDAYMAKQGIELGNVETVALLARARLRKVPREELIRAIEGGTIESIMSRVISRSRG